MSLFIYRLLFRQEKNNKKSIFSRQYYILKMYFFVNFLVQQVDKILEVGHLKYVSNYKDSILSLQATKLF